MRWQWGSRGGLRSRSRRARHGLATAALLTPLVATALLHPRPHPPTQRPPRAHPPQLRLALLCMGAYVAALAAVAASPGAQQLFGTLVELAPVAFASLDAVCAALLLALGALYRASVPPQLLRSLCVARVRSAWLRDETQ